MGMRLRGNRQRRLSSRCAWVRRAFPMTVRRKTLLIIAITCLGMIVVLYAASRWFLRDGFIKLEQNYAKENVQRVLNALDQDFGAIDRFTLDRASTTESYTAMEDPSLEFIGSLLGKDASGSTQTRRFNFILLVDSAGPSSPLAGSIWPLNRPSGFPPVLRNT
jgi:sensor domain CHASE-containing protein